MIDFRKIEVTIVNGLQELLSAKGFKCLVIRSNQTAKAPDYPYISYTVPSPVVSDTAHYSAAEDGTRFKSLEQIWSFTAQSGDQEEAANIALLAYDWFALTGNTYLSDNNIVPLRVGNITNRDNLLTVEYEYRQGFDVDFSLLHCIEKADNETAGYIENADITPIKEV